MSDLIERLRSLLSQSNAFVLHIATVRGWNNDCKLLAVHRDCLEIETSKGRLAFIQLSKLVAIEVEYN